MKVTKVSVVLVLSLVLVCGFQSLAAAQLLKKTTQLVNLSSASTTGILDGDWLQVMPDGTTAVFTIPPKKVVVLNSVSTRFVPTSKTVTGPLRLLIQDPTTGNLFFTRNLSLTTDADNYVVSAICDYDFNPGLALGIKPKISIIKPTTGPNTGDVIPGDFGMRFLGTLP
jgi:hypothetical protein